MGRMEALERSAAATHTGLREPRNGRVGDVASPERITPGADSADAGRQADGPIRSAETVVLLWPALSVRTSRYR